MSSQESGVAVARWNVLGRARLLSRPTAGCRAPQARHRRRTRPPRGERSASSGSPRVPPRQTPGTRRLRPGALSVPRRSWSRAWFRRTRTHRGRVARCALRAHRRSRRGRSRRGRPSRSRRRSEPGRRRARRSSGVSRVSRAPRSRSWTRRATRRRARGPGSRTRARHRHPGHSPPRRPGTSPAPRRATSRLCRAARDLSSVTATDRDRQAPGLQPRRAPGLARERPRPGGPSVADRIGRQRVPQAQARLRPSRCARRCSVAAVPVRRRRPRWSPPRSPRPRSRCRRPLGPRRPRRRSRGATCARPGEPPPRGPHPAPGGRPPGWRAPRR